MFSKIRRSRLTFLKRFLNMQEQEDISIKDYIKEVLTQIGEAINECNSDNVANSKMIVNPARAEGKTFGNYTYAVNPKDQTHQRIVDIDFEISVAATKSKGVSGGLSVAALNLGGKNSKEIEAANKVKFTIPVIFPSAKENFSK